MGGGTIALTRDQIKGIQDVIPTRADDRERCLIALLAYTSMRREEILALKWESIDFDANTIHINQALVYPNSIPTLKQTKSWS